MWKALIFLVLLISAIGISALFDNNPDESVKGETEVEKLILGYCETFERFAFDIEQKNENVVLKKLDSSATVLSEVKNGDITYGLIGRKAYAFEIDSSIQEIPLLEMGLTLISDEKGFVSYEDLENMEVHTYIDEEVVNDFINSESIFFHDDMDTALEEGLKTAVLISWQDWRDDFMLLIPIDGIKKVEKFRTPLLYTKEETLNITL